MLKLLSFIITRWTTFLGTTLWECPTWLDMVYTTRRGYTIEEARFHRFRPIRPESDAKLDLNISSAQTQTQMSWLELWLVGPPILQIRSLIQGLSISSLSPLLISMHPLWACLLSFQLILDVAHV